MQGTRESRKRRVHGAEFKAKVVAQCKAAGASVAAVAQANGVDASVVRRWLNGQGLKRCAGLSPAAGGRAGQAAAQARAQRTRGLALGDLFLDDRIGISLDDPVVDSQISQIARQDFGRKARLLLVEIHGDQPESNGRPLQHGEQHVEQGVRVLAAGDADQNGVAILDHVVVDDGLADATFKKLSQLLQGIRGFHGGPS